MLIDKTLIVLALTAAITVPAAGDGPPPSHPQQAQVACCEQCVTHSCRLVPEIKQIKKTVYEVQEVPYCVKKLPPLWSLFHHHGCDCETCAECDCVRYKKVLVKKEIVVHEVCTTRCVVEEHLQTAPCQPASK